jgi:hypothetical protein
MVTPLQVVVFRAENGSSVTMYDRQVGELRELADDDFAFAANDLVFVRTVGDPMGFGENSRPPIFRRGELDEHGAAQPEAPLRE